MFEDIRPYNDEEASAALKKVAGSPLMASVSNYLFPDKGEGWLAKELSTVSGVNDFQQRVMSKAMERIIKRTTDGLTYGGIDNFLRQDGSVGKFLLLSSHRDIVLDPAFIQIVFFRNNFPLTEIAVGDNLMGNPVVEDMIRSNRMIKVIRSENPREVYSSSKILSEYIRKKITEDECSIWLAHRQGRTKDGRDATEQGLLKMLDMSGNGTFLENFEELPIMPVAISYEFETCGALKSLELWTKKLNGFYKKKEGEDLNSMIQGITQYKGRVHVEFCKPLTKEEFEDADSFDKNDKFRRLAEIADCKILSAFKRWPNNYIAADMLSGKNTYFGVNYTEEEKRKFERHIDAELSGMPFDVKEVLLNMYNTLDFDEKNKLNLSI